MKIALSRTDNIGDVILTLPTAGLLKREIPDAQIVWIGKAYTRDLIASCKHVDAFQDATELLTCPEKWQFDAVVHVFPSLSLAKAAARARVPVRIGTSHRWFHWFYCNRLVPLGRKNSPLHESQLNIRLLKPLLGKDPILPLQEIADLYGFAAPDITLRGLPEKPFIVLHPKSRGSAREWSAENYLRLAQILEKQGFDCVVTGTATEGEAVRRECPALLHQAGIHDWTGKVNLAELIKLIDQSAGLVACSTGPLHIAAALGKPAVGIYPPMRPLHPGRWGPVGKLAQAVVIQKTCRACGRFSSCACIAAVTPEKAAEALLSKIVG